jgi:hypothetical protein
MSAPAERSGLRNVRLLNGARSAAAGLVLPMSPNRTARHHLAADGAICGASGQHGYQDDWAGTVSVGSGAVSVGSGACLSQRDADGAGCAYRWRQTGGRFSRNAIIPSSRSAVANSASKRSRS